MDIHKFYQLLYHSKVKSLVLLIVLFFSSNFINLQAQVPGNALNFDGTNDYVNLGTTLSFPNTTAFTIEAWICRKPNSGGMVIGKRNGGIAGQFYLRVNTNGTIEFQREVSPYTFTTTTAILENRWTHIAGTYDGTTMITYINGVASGSMASGSVGSSINSTSANVLIGANEYLNDPSDFFWGSIDEVRFWNSARSQSAIQATMYNEISTTTSGLLHYYKFNAASGTALSDQCTSPVNGTLTDFLLSGATSNWVESYAMVVPTALTTTAVTLASFTANWTAPIGTVDKYLLDVATDEAFTSMVAGYTAKDIGNVTSYNVTGLVHGTTYYWRVRASKASVLGQAAYTTVQSVDVLEPLNLTSTTATNNFNLLSNAGVIVDPNITINYTYAIDGFSVVLSNGKQTGDVLSYSGTLPSGITATAYDSTTGILRFNGTTTPANWQTLLRTVTFRANLNAGLDRTISFSAGRYNSFNNGHFYQFVPAAQISWSNAKTAVVSLKHLNYSGYLTTVTSVAEHNFIKQILSADAWIGASDSFTEINAVTGTTTYANQSASEGKWYWVTGPEAGTQFWNGAANGSQLTYANWHTGLEPNNSGNNEHYAGIWTNNNSQWNDFINDNTSLGGYIVEYGGMANDIVQTPSYTLTMSVLGTPPGNALSFDGTNDYIYTPTLINSPTTFTLEAWFNTTATTTGGIVGFNNIHSNTSVSSYDRFIWMEADGKIKFGVYNGNLNSLISTNSYNDGKYHHVAASFSTSTGMKLYIDGVLIANNTISTVNNYDGYWKIGGFQNWGNGIYFNGKIDEVRIWSTVRSLTEIQNNMLNVIAPTASGLNYYYNFDQGISSGTNTGNTTLYNQTSTANDGTLSGFALSNASSNWVESYAMVVPLASSNSAIIYNGFTANWTASTLGSADNYFLDVSDNAGFTTFVTGYNNKNVGTATSFAVTGLSPFTTYYWRVRSNKTTVTGQGGFSNVLTVKTAKEPINITSTTTTTTFDLLTNAAIIVDPNLVINHSQTINGFRVLINTNKQEGDVLAYTGTLPSGITPVAYNASTGVLAFTGTTSAANWQAFLRTVTFRAYKNSGVARSISFSAGALNSFSNGHFYKYFPSTGITWSDAKTAAESDIHLNYSGYLATVSSADENAFIKQVLSADAWFGASDEYSKINAATGTNTYANQAASEGKWYWVTGPEAGTQFWNGNVVAGNYVNWNTNEPNNSSSSEHFGQFYNTNNGTWNDLPNSYSTISGYIVEYGGLTSDIVQTPSYSLTMNVTAEEPGNALNFNGTNSFVNIPDSNSLDLTTNYTIEAWIKPESFNELGGIVDKYQTGAAFGYHLRLGFTAPYTGINFDELSTANGVLTAGKWYHIAGVNNAGTRTLYINGVSVPLTGAAMTVQVNSDPIRIGCDFTTRFFDGNIDEVRIWNVARTQAQIVANMIGTLAPTTPNLVSYYNFNQGIPSSTNTGLTTLYDQTGTLNNGTLNNFGNTGATNNWVESYAMVVPMTTAATSKYSLGFTANWTASTLGTAEKYYLDVATDAAFTSLVSGYSNKDVGTVTSYDINLGITANTTYYYRVRADKSSVTGSGAYSNVTSVTTDVTETLVATAASNRTSTSFTANWEAPAIHNIAAYLLDVSTVSDFASFVSGYEGLSVNGLSQAVTGLTPDTVYYYRVRVANYNNSNTITTSTIAPFATITTSATSVCVDGTTPTITFTGSGSSAPYTFIYTINGGSNLTISTTSGNTVTLTAPTATAGVFNYTLVSVTDINSGTNPQSDAVEITINALPTPTFTEAPSATICSNTEVTYTTQSGQSNYIWNVPGISGTDYSITSGTIGTTSNTVTLKWLSDGSKTVTVNYTNSSNCTNTIGASATTTVSLTPNVAAITGTTSTTVGLSTTLSNATTGGVWSSSNETVAGINATANVTAIGIGTATISYTVTAGSCTNTVTTSYTVSAAPTPTITAVSPINPVVGTTITITGTNFSGTSLVTIGGTVVTFTLVSPTSITFVLPLGTGNNLAVAVTTPGGTATSASPNLITYNTAQLPTITSIAPTSAGTGQTVVIKGTNLTNPTTITFGGTAVASYTVNSATQITAIIDSGTSGSVVVTTAHQTAATLTGFTYLTCSGNPTLYSGGSMTACASSSSINITADANASNYTALTWTTSGTGTFTNNTTVNALTNTMYAPSSADILAGSVTLTLTATANSGCLNQVSSKTLTIDPSSVGGTISGATSVCTGINSSTLTLIGYTGSISKWQSSTTNDFSAAVTDIAATTSSITTTNLTTTTYYRAVVVSGVCTSNSDIVAITVNSSTIWTGAVSTLWNTSANWSCNAVPNTYSNVIIEATTNQPDLTTDVSMNSLTLNASTTLTIPSGLDVTVTNYIHNSGILTVENNANLIQVNDVTNTGNIIVHRNSAPIVRLDHTLWSSPVAGQNLFAFSPATLTNRFYTYNTGTNSYVTTGLNSTSTFEAGKGFAVRAPNNQTATTPTAWPGTFTGVPNNGTIPFTLDTATPSYNLVGNPFPSTLSAASFVSGNPNISGTLYFYAHSLSMSSTGLFPSGTNYATWNASGTTVATHTNGDVHLTPEAPNGTIQVGQGFIVKAVAAGTLNFTNTMRTGNSSNQFFRMDTIEKNRLWLNLKTGAGIEINQILVGYITDATQAEDRDFDGLSFGNTGSFLSSKIASNDYVIQGRSLPFDSNDSVPLGFTADIAGNYSIALTNKDGIFADTQDVFLKDDLTGIIHDIKATAYDFASNAGTFDARFSLIYTNALANVSTNFTPNTVVVFKDNQWFTVNTNGIIMKDVFVYDMAGRMILQQSGINASTTILKGLSQTNGVLLVKIVSQENEVVTVKVIN